MPAYLSLSFQYSKNRLTGQTVRSFCDTLIRCGLTFAGGYWGAEDDSYDQIIQWNQAKLEDNFQLGFTEHYSHNYKQMLFRYEPFSEVRLFIMNFQKEAYFSFELIIPEHDFWDESDEPGFRIWLSRLRRAEDMAIRMWEAETMDCIQAGWELSAGQVAFSDIIAGHEPLADPFCILPQDCVRDKWNGTIRFIGRNGACIRNLGDFPTME